MSNTIPLAKAEEGLKAIFDVAAKDGKPPIAVAIVDRHGDLIHFARMDGAPVRSSLLAPNKAYTAAAFQQPTEELAGLSQQSWFTSLITSTQGKIMAVGGGVPVREPVGVIGAVGVSGGTPEQDQECCQAASAALG